MDTPRKGPPCDCPETLAELRQRFYDEPACYRFLERLRWPGGFACVWCGSREEPLSSRRGTLACAECRHALSLVAGTTFAGTIKPLRFWIEAIWLAASGLYPADPRAVAGALRLGPSSDLGLYLDKLRRLLAPPDAPPLEGVVEIDRVRLTLGRADDCLRFPLEPCDVLVAVELDRDDADEPRRVRLRHVSHDLWQAMARYAAEVVAPGSAVRTAMPETSGEATLANARRIGRLLQASIGASGLVTPRTLPYALDEFGFHLEAGADATPGQRFHRLMRRAVGELAKPPLGRQTRSGSGVRRRFDAPEDEAPAPASADRTGERRGHG
ncbi:MAG: transposase [Myxococcales bacterium]|nr:transposase [Myxococcales bacterium]